MKKSAATSIRTWGRTLGRTCGFLAALAAGLAFSAPANADWHGHGDSHGHGDWHHGGFHRDHFHGRVFLGFGGFGPFWPYYDPFFYPYPAYYGPPPAYYPAPYGAPATISPQANCIKFNGDATNDQTGQPFYGTACIQADGKWHIVGN
jgi:hypothetical protein